MNSTIIFTRVCTLKNILVHNYNTHLQFYKEYDSVNDVTGDDIICVIALNGRCCWYN